MRDWGEISVGIEARLRFVVLRGLRGVAVAAQPRERLGHLRLALRGIVGAFAEAEVKVVAAQLQGILQPRIRVGGRFVVVVLALLAVEVRPIVVRAILLAQALERGPGLDQCAVDGEVIVRHEAQHRKTYPGFFAGYSGSVGG